MAFNVNEVQERKKVVLELEVVGNHYKYLLPRLKRSELIKAQSEARKQGIVSGDDSAEVFIFRVIMDSVEALDGAPDIYEVTDQFNDDTYKDFVKYVLELVTADISKLVNQGIEVR